MLIFFNLILTFSIPQLPVFVYHGNKKTRQKALCLFCKTGGVCITTYQLSAAIADNIAELGQTEDESIKKIIETQTDSQPSDNFSLQSLFWDYTIIDEAHTIKNHDNKLSQDVRRAGGRKRLALTGTPITNNLQVCTLHFSSFHFICSPFYHSLSSLFNADLIFFLQIRVDIHIEREREIFCCYSNNSSNNPHQK